MTIDGVLGRVRRWRMHRNAPLHRCKMWVPITHAEPHGPAAPAVQCALPAHHSPAFLHLVNPEEVKDLGLLRAPF